MVRPNPTIALILGATTLALFAPATLSSQQATGDATHALTAQEQPIIAWIDEHEDDAIRLLERAVNINSGTLNAEGNRRVAEVFMAELEPLGFEVRYVELPDSLDRGGHLIAERDGTQGRSLLLIGHLDTVFEEDSPFQRFEIIDEGTAAGPGVADMKGGDVVIVQALKALAAADALDGASITVVMTGDEEAPGRPLSVSRELLIDAGRRSDVALGFEGGSRDDDGTEYGVIARRSSSGWRLTVDGRRSHSSGVFSEGVGAGAIFEAARILNAFYEEVRGERYLTFNPGVILGGTDVTFDDGEARGTAFGKTNVVAQSAVVSGGIRTISDEQLERAREAMRRIVQQHLPHTSAGISFLDGYPAMPPTDANGELLATFSDVSQDLGYGPLQPFDPGGRGAADVSFVAPYVEAAMDGLGPVGDGSHSVEETVDLASIGIATKRAALLIYRLTRAEPVM